MNVTKNGQSHKLQEACETYQMFSPMFSRGCRLIGSVLVSICLDSQVFEPGSGIVRWVQIRLNRTCHTSSRAVVIIAPVDLIPVPKQSAKQEIP